MYAITEKERNIDGTIITTFSRDIYNANVLEVEAGTNGYQGGDSGHGSRTYFRIENAGGTAIEDAPGWRGDERMKLYLAYLRDPAGNKVCVMHRPPKAAA